VAERTKESIETRTKAGSNPATGGIFLRAVRSSSGSRKEIPPTVIERIERIERIEPHSQ